MTDDLRTRIAAALKAEDERWHGDPFTQPPATYESLADAVIEELGLSQQWLSDGIISDGEPRPWEVPCETRYATGAI